VGLLVQPQPVCVRAHVCVCVRAHVCVCVCACFASGMGLWGRTCWIFKWCWRMAQWYTRPGYEEEQSERVTLLVGQFVYH